MLKDVIYLDYKLGTKCSKHKEKNHNCTPEEARNKTPCNPTVVKNCCRAQKFHQRT